MGMISTNIMTIMATSKIRIMYGNGEDTTCTTLRIRTSLSFLRRRRGLIGDDNCCCFLLLLLLLGEEEGEAIGDGKNANRGLEEEDDEDNERKVGLSLLLLLKLRERDRESAFPLSSVEQRQRDKFNRGTGAIFRSLLIRKSSLLSSETLARGAKSSGLLTVFCISKSPSGVRSLLLMLLSTIAESISSFSPSLFSSLSNSLLSRSSLDRRQQRYTYPIAMQTRQNKHL